MSVDVITKNSWGALRMAIPKRNEEKHDPARRTVTVSGTVSQGLNEVVAHWSHEYGPIHPAGDNIPNPRAYLFTYLIGDRLDKLAVLTAQARRQAFNGSDRNVRPVLEELIGRPLPDRPAARGSAGADGKRPKTNQVRLLDYHSIPREIAAIVAFWQDGYGELTGTSLIEYLLADRLATLHEAVLDDEVAAKRPGVPRTTFHAACRDYLGIPGPNKYCREL